jgi:hypothetical protein
MDARKVAAQFAAYVWFEDKIAGRCRPKAATRFAREHWSSFLPVADEGWGRLLIRMFGQRQRDRRRPRSRPRAVAIGA